MIWLFYFYKNIISNSIVRATLRFMLKAGLKPFYFPLHWLNLFSRINTMSSVELLLFFPPSGKYYLSKKKRSSTTKLILSGFLFHFLDMYYFFLKITIIIQFKLTLCIYVYSSHISDRSHFNIWPYLYDYFTCSTFWRDNCRSFSGIICLIHLEQECLQNWVNLKQNSFLKESWKRKQVDKIKH